MKNNIIFFPWDTAYAIGVPAIDSEHRHLVSLVNKFHEAHTKETEQDECVRLLMKIVEHTCCISSNCLVTMYEH